MAIDWAKLPADKAAAIRAKIGEKIRQAWANREQNGYATRKNGSLLPEVQKKISDAVKSLWENGQYDLRVNGMTGIHGAEHHGWSWGAYHFNEILRQHEPMACALCGDSAEKIDAHHIDEDHQNYLLTNLVWYCVPCHMWKMHYRKARLPKIKISKRFAFEYAHILPWHPGKCSLLHGHSGHLEVTVKGRLDPHGVVMDFKDLGDAVKLAVVDRLDHRFLNDYVANPTSENLLIWIWRALEEIGVKGLTKIVFSETDSSSCCLTAADMLEAFGWDQTQEGQWVLVNKPYPSPEK